MTEQHNDWAKEYKIRNEYLKSNEIEYQDYLNSKHWIELSDRFKNEKMQCFHCGTFRSLRVHHVTYQNMGNEQPEDLMVLCTDCHDEAHDVPPGQFKEKPASEYLEILTEYDTKSVFWLFSRSFYFALKRRISNGGNIDELLKKYESISMKFDDYSAQGDLEQMEEIYENGFNPT